MKIELIIYLIFIHWIADFVCQNKSMAELKSKSSIMLLCHCGVYCGIFLLFTQNILYSTLLGLLHFPIDYITSRINSELYSKKDIHNFFVSVGFDQFIHLTIIILLGEKLL